MIQRLSVLLAALLVPAAAAAQDVQPEAQVGAVIQCLDIPAIEERVRCYDRAAAALRAGLRSGAVVVAAPRPADTPSRVQGRIASASSVGGRWEVVLNNGQTWRTHDSNVGRPPADGADVRIHRNFIGTYWMRVAGRQVQVVRIQ
jgi:hypothetical protein